jgi:fructoselysine 6-kinase
MSQEANVESVVSIIGVGDNTMDQYIHLRRMFPGGNAVNVPVLARRYGHRAGYIGWLGNDALGRLLLDALVEEGVDVSRCRVVEGPNAYCQVSLVDGDRVFGESSAGVTPLLALTEDDLVFIRQHDIAHTSIYSHIEKDLPRLSWAANRLSFDFSQGWKRDYLAQALPHVSYAFLSCSHVSEDETGDLLRWAHAWGPNIIVATRGRHGALAYDGQRLYRQGVVETTVVDTLGAGDAFIARFLVEFNRGESVEGSLALAAVSAAETCGYYGAFERGAPF